MSSWNGLAILAVAALLAVPLAVSLGAAWFVHALGGGTFTVAAVSVTVFVVAIAWMWDN